MFKFKFGIHTTDDLDAISTKARSFLLKKALNSKFDDINTMKELATNILKIKGQPKSQKSEVYLRSPSYSSLSGVSLAPTPFHVNTLFFADNKNKKVAKDNYHKFLDCNFYLGVHDYRGYFLVDFNEIDGMLYAIIETIPMDAMTMQYNGREQFHTIDDLITSRTLTIYNIDTGESHSYYPKTKIEKAKFQAFNTSIPLIKSRFNTYGLLHDNVEIIIYNGENDVDDNSVCFMYNVLGGEFTEDYLSKNTVEHIIPQILKSDGVYNKKNSLYDILSFAEGFDSDKNNAKLYNDLKRIGYEKYNDESLFIEKSMHYIALMLTYSSITIFDFDAFDIHNYIQMYEKEAGDNGYLISRWINHPEFLNGPIYKVVEDDEDESLYDIKLTDVGEKIHADVDFEFNYEESVFTSYKFLKEFIYPSLLDKERIKDYLKRSYYVEN